MAQQVEELELDPQIFLGGPRELRVVIWPLHVYCSTQAYTHTLNK